MTFDEFRESLKNAGPPAGISALPGSLWHQAWGAAHRIAQNTPTAAGSRVHAYLHRKEGDIGNARCRCSRTGRLECRDSLDQEWEQPARELLDER